MASPGRTFAPLGGPARPTPSASNGHVTSACWSSMSSAGTTHRSSVGFIRTSTISWSRSLASVRMGRGQSATTMLANAGSFIAPDNSALVSTAQASCSRGSIDYSVTRARWLDRYPDMRISPRRASDAIRHETEDLHDVTTSVATGIPETATRVFVFYRINTGYPAPIRRS